ncbi:HAD-IA family hydrolase [Streptomyces pathocidini]|uniref:HAD family hydrolase n=1 Tax=Streptomyces pathocidini TaxID=1650571 RepID=UPI00340F9B5A
MVFDLDGTLVDSWQLHLCCLRSAVQAVGAGGASAARLSVAQRPTDVGTLIALVGEHRVEPALRAYREELDRALREHPAPAPVMPHAPEVLAALRDRGAAVGVCTGRSRADAQALLDACELDVRLTVAREDAPLPKPAPDGLRLALRRLGLRPEEALYVGDSPADREQGEAARVRTLLLDRSPSAGGPWASATRIPDLGCLLKELGRDAGR